MNVRRWICKDLKPKKGGWLYRTCDCQRYNNPVPPVPPVPPIPPTLPPKYIGVSAYQLIKYPFYQIQDYLSGLSAAVSGNGPGYTRHPITEVFFDFTWDQGYAWQPFKQVGTRADVGSAYGEYLFPVYDLDQWDEKVWSKWRDIWAECKSKGVTISVRITDQCSLRDGFEKRHNAFRSNIQRLDQGILTGGLYGGPIRKWYKLLADRLVRELNTSGVDYFINPWNEFDVILDGWTEAEGDAKAVEVMTWWTNELQKAGCPHDRILISTSREWGKMSKWGFIMEEHGCASPQRMNMEISAAHESDYLVFPNGDGPDKDAEGAANFKGYREPSVEQARIMKDLLTPGHVMGYSYLSRSYEETQQTDLNKVTFDVVKALSGKE